MKEEFEDDIVECLKVLRRGGIILYPTDTIWGLGCDATKKDAVAKLYDLKRREDHKSMILLMSDEREVLQYVAAPDLAVFDYLQQQPEPTTVIFENAVNLPDNVTGKDGSVAIRITKDVFCRHLVKRLGAPLVSTSANLSNTRSPGSYQSVSDEIKSGVDYIVKWRQNDNKLSTPSCIIKWNRDGSVTIVR